MAFFVIYSLNIALLRDGVFYKYILFKEKAKIPLLQLRGGITLKKWMLSLFTCLLALNMAACSNANEEEGPVEDPEMQENAPEDEENVNEDDGTIDQEDDDTMNQDGKQEGDQDEDGNMEEGDMDDAEKQPNDETEDQQ